MRTFYHTATSGDWGKAKFLSKKNSEKKLSPLENPGRAVKMNGKNHEKCHFCTLKLNFLWLSLFQSVPNMLL